LSNGIANHDKRSCPNVYHDSLSHAELTDYMAALSRERESNQNVDGSRNALFEKIENILGRIHEYKQEVDSSLDDMHSADGTNSERSEATTILPYLKTSFTCAEPVPDGEGD
jgi:hypothetical protein